MYSSVCDALSACVSLAALVSCGADGVYLNHIHVFQELLIPGDWIGCKYLWVSMCMCCRYSTTDACVPSGTGISYSLYTTKWTSPGWFGNSGTVFRSHPLAIHFSWYQISIDWPVCNHGELGINEQRQATKAEPRLKRTRYHRSQQMRKLKHRSLLSSHNLELIND